MKIFLSFSNGQSNSFTKYCTRFHNYFALIVIQRSITTPCMGMPLSLNQMGIKAGNSWGTLKREGGPLCCFVQRYQMIFPTLSRLSMKKTNVLLILPMMYIVVYYIAFPRIDCLPCQKQQHFFLTFPVGF